MTSHPIPADISGLACLARDLTAGPFPVADGWGWLYRTFERVARPDSQLRRIVCGYFWPCALERWQRGRVYRWLGVHLFGAVIPTGGIVIRRAFRARMAPYTLAGNSIRAARAFYYRTCVFEALHMPFFLTLAFLAIQRAAVGRLDFAVQNVVINAAINLYPMMHHRRTRVRILQLLHAGGGRLSRGSEPASVSEPVHSRRGT